MTDNWNLLGHEWAVEMLRRHIATGEMRHAYLFTGPPGVGRRSLGLAFVRALCCTHPPAPGDFCGECRDCKQVERHAYPDLHIIEPTIKDPDNPKELKPDLYGEIRIQQIRDLGRVINLKPYQARHRFVMCLRFDQASLEASNAFLKTLEEPPAHAILLLTAENPESLLPTVVSRCEVLRLRPLPIEQVEKELKRRGADDSAAQLVAHLSGGRPGYALQLLADPAALEVRNQRLEDLSKLLADSRVDKFSYAEKLAKKDRKEIRQTLMCWLSFWRDVFLRAASSELPLENVDRLGEIESQARRLDLASARARVTEAERAIRQFDQYVNSRLLLEVLLLGWKDKGGA